MKKIGYLGFGVWGYALGCILASKGYKVTAWSIEEEVIAYLKKKREHPKFPGYIAPPTLSFSSSFEEALFDQDIVVEGVTAKGIREVFGRVHALGTPSTPFVITSKGIEQNTGLLLSEVMIEVLGEERRKQIACLSGPSIADEVVKGMPTSVVCSAYDSKVMTEVHKVFQAPTFRVYSNPDINGIELGGALKNIIAIACGVSDGLGYGNSAKASLVTRGLHEMKKIAPFKGAQAETLNGLSGIGDLCVTCFSPISRNFRFGRLIAEGLSPDEARQRIGMAIEGAYTAVSALQLAKKVGVEMPITEYVYKVLYEKLNPKEAVKALLQRMIKDEFS